MCSPLMSWQTGRLESELVQLLKLAAKLLKIMEECCNISNGSKFMSLGFYAQGILFELIFIRFMISILPQCFDSRSIRLIKKRE